MQQTDSKETDMYEKLRVGDKTISPIDWEMTPDLSFGTYESWGGRERVRNNDERVYYFFVDAWGKRPKVCLMERGIKHAKILAEIAAPADIVSRCVDGQGRSARDMGAPLPLLGEAPLSAAPCTLPSEAAIISEEQAQEIITRWGFFDTFLNPRGRFAKVLRRTGDAQVVVDERTSLMWQRGGIDITSTRTMRQRIDDLNGQGFAGFSDWRLPTLEEAMSLLEPVENAKGIHLHPCFSKEQPFIFVSAQRRPGGHWFVDFKHGRAFYSSGTIPGGFGRLVRTVNP